MPEQELGEDRAYFLVQDLGSVDKAGAAEDDGRSDESLEGASGPVVLWRSWLRLPPLSAGERSVRVSDILNASMRAYKRWHSCSILSR